MKKKPAQKKITAPRRAKSSSVSNPNLTLQHTLVVAGSALIFGFAAFFFAHLTKPFCANSISCIHDLNAQVDNNAVALFEGQQITPPQINLAVDTVNPTVLGVASASGEKRIYVDLSSQTLYAYQGESQVMTTLISSGKWGRTPVGDFKIWVKIRSTRMAGGEGADAYNLPNVPYVMFFANDQVPKSAGFSFHGAYWHNNFGHAMSHGCINMREVDARALYDWASPDTKSSTTYSSTEDPGTNVSICNQVQFQEGAVPSCVN